MWLLLLGLLLVAVGGGIAISKLLVPLLFALLLLTLLGVTARRSTA